MLTETVCSPILTDNFGRKLPIAIGCVIMIVGAVIQGSCQNLAGTSILQSARR